MPPPGRARQAKLIRTSLADLSGEARRAKAEARQREDGGLPLTT
jgi:hypothetical protein